PVGSPEPDGGQEVLLARGRGVGQAAGRPAGAPGKAERLSRHATTGMALMACGADQVRCGWWVMAGWWSPEGSGGAGGTRRGRSRRGPAAGPGSPRHQAVAAGPAAAAG